MRIRDIPPVKIVGCVATEMVRVSGAHRHPESDGPPEIPANLDAILQGRLPCITCHYDLQGISIRDLCPECGTAVRATILSEVDPKADELKPLTAARFTAMSLAVWAVAGFAASVCVWVLRVAEMLESLLGQRIAADWAVPFLLAATTICGVAMLGLIRPVRLQPAWKTIAAAFGALLFIPLVWLLFEMHAVYDRSAGPPYFSTRGADPERTLLRLGTSATLAAILILIRPNARDLVRRCLALRTGRVGRQTLLAMVAVLGLASLGDVLILWASVLPSTAVAFADVLLYLGRTLILLGSLLLTLGLYHVILDSRRIGGVLLHPPPSMDQVIGRVSEVTDSD